MPFDPNFPFDPADPSQWWRTRILPRNFVQPSAPSNGALGNPAGTDGMDDWIAPRQAPIPTDHPNNWPAPWSAETDALFPDDWIYPDSRSLTPAAAPSTASTAPSPPSTAANPATSNRPAPRFDPFAAYWSQIPASRAGALAWAPPIFLSADPSSPQNIPASVWGTSPPIFPNPFGQFPLAANAPPGFPPGIGTGGILGGIPKMIAAQAKANDPWEAAANGILGGIPKMIAASTSSDPVSLAASRGLFGSLANLQPAASTPQADASYLPDSQPFLSPDPIRYQGGPSYAYLRNDRLNLAGLTWPAADQPPTDFDIAPETAQENASPNVLLVAGGEEEKEHDKLDPAVFTGLSDNGPTTPPKTLPTLPLPLPLFPRPSLPPTSASQPPPRTSLPPPTSPPPSASPPPLLGQGATSQRPSGTPTGPAPSQSVAPSAQSPADTLDGLRRHVVEAQARLDQVGLTAAQKASLKYNPWLEPMHRGERIDTFAKETVAKDKSLGHLQITPRFKFGPDFYDPINKVWYDITKIGQWKGHEGRYTLGFGQGIPLLYGGDK
jgi:hypothetical protein